jgi:hypothetical protein
MPASMYAITTAGLPIARLPKSCQAVETDIPLAFSGSVACGAHFGMKP